MAVSASSSGACVQVSLPCFCPTPDFPPDIISKLQRNTFVRQNEGRPGDEARDVLIGPSLTTCQSWPSTSEMPQCLLHVYSGSRAHKKGN